MGRKLGGAVPLWGEGAGSPSDTINVARAEAYLHAKFHLDPSNPLATIHQHYRQTDRTVKQRSDRIGRTVLQTVAQNVLRKNRLSYAGYARRAAKEPVHGKTPQISHTVYHHKLAFSIGLAE